MDLDAAGDFTETADDIEDYSSDEPEQQHPSSPNRSSHTTGPTKFVSDEAAFAFPVVDKKAQDDAEQVAMSPLPL